MSTQKKVIIAIVIVVVIGTIIGIWYWNKNKKAKKTDPGTTSAPVANIAGDAGSSAIENASAMA
jgi:multidrug resistance efflux pump